MKRGAWTTLCIIWLFSAGLMLPWAVYYKYQVYSNTSDTFICQPLWPDPKQERIFLVFGIFVGTYVLPLAVVFLCYMLIAWRVWHRNAPGVVVGTCYIRRCKIKVVKMLATVVLMFAITRLPLYVIHIFLDLQNTDTIIISNVATPIAQWLNFSNSGMNPIIYSCFSCNYRHGFRNVWYFLIRKRSTLTGSYKLSIHVIVFLSLVLLPLSMSSSTRLLNIYSWTYKSIYLWQWGNTVLHASSRSSDLDCKLLVDLQLIVAANLYNRWFFSTGISRI